MLSPKLLRRCLPCAARSLRGTDSTQPDPHPSNKGGVVSSPSRPAPPLSSHPIFLVAFTSLHLLAKELEGAPQLAFRYGLRRSNLSNRSILVFPFRSFRPPSAGHSLGRCRMYLRYSPTQYPVLQIHQSRDRQPPFHSRWPLQSLRQYSRLELPYPGVELRIQPQI
jgi:hypothetical protein